MSQSVRERVSDKGKQRLDSGPIKKKLGPLDKKKIEMICLAIGRYNQGSFIFKNLIKFIKGKQIPHST